MTIKIWFISDTHGEHEGLQVPQAMDAVIHCGDESNSGNAWLNEPESRKFFAWYSELDMPKKFFVPGNHSTAIEQGLVRPEDYPDIEFLIHQSTQWRGLEIFGSPYTPRFFDWAYMREREDLDEVWQSIPAGVDILITHGPPKGIGDVTKDVDSRLPVHVGSKSLMRQVVERIKPRIHAFGHIHDERGIDNVGRVVKGPTEFINCACCDLPGRLKHHGTIVEIAEQS
ncbi:MAG: metallophosphoesterase [Pirellulaceae bacterium]|jgi:Icc-related predicted phosphoesterase|nr:metallophosphoesterase [Pirellulaceae bacterium]